MIALRVVTFLAALLAPGLAQACSCMMTDVRALLGQGLPVARVAITAVDMPPDINGWVVMKATVVESFTGALPSGEVTLVTGGNSAMCGYPLAAGETAVLVLHPQSDATDAAGDLAADYQVSLCTSTVVGGEEARPVLEDYAARRAAGQGVWVDVVRFREVLATQPTIAELQAAFPGINVIGPDEIVTMDMRYDQSRFFPDLDAEGRVTGGDFH